MYLYMIIYGMWREKSYYNYYICIIIYHLSHVGHRPSRYILWSWFAIDACLLPLRCIPPGPFPSRLATIRSRISSVFLPSSLLLLFLRSTGFSSYCCSNYVHEILAFSHLDGFKLIWFDLCSFNYFFIRLYAHIQIILVAIFYGHAYRASNDDRQTKIQT